MLNFSVTQNGKPLNTSLYTWDEKTRTFSTKENGLVLDFTGIDDCTFDTGYNCTFKTGYNCTFKTGSRCTFKTGDYCVVVRRDVHEIIELQENQKIKLNCLKKKGYEVINEHKIIIDDKEIMLSEESFNELKKSLTSDSI